MSGNEFWQGRRVCVTGGAGFLGSYVVGRLKEAGAEDVFVPRASEFDLREKDSIRRM